MTNPTKKNDGKIRDINIRLAFMKRNLKFFEQDGMEFCNEYGINSTNVVDLAGFDFNKNIFYRFWAKACLSFGEKRSPGRTPDMAP